MKTKVKWDNHSNPADHGWVYLEESGDWQAVPGGIGRDRDASPEDLEAVLGHPVQIFH